MGKAGGAADSRQKFVPGQHLRQGRKEGIVSRGVVIDSTATGFIWWIFPHFCVLLPSFSPDLALLSQNMQEE